MSETFAPHDYRPAVRLVDLDPIPHNQIRKFHTALMARSGKVPVPLCKLAGRMPYALVQYGSNGGRWKFIRSAKTTEELLADTAAIDATGRVWRIVCVKDGLIVEQG